MNAVRSFLLVVCAFAATVAAPAGAFELLRSTGNTCSADSHLRWSPNRVMIDTTDLGESRRGLGEEAVDAWRQVLGTRLQLVSGSGQPCARDGVTTLAFTDVDCMGNPFAGDTLAITVTSWTGNRITDADVSFNPAVRLSNASFRQVAMHEVGHVIGLDHSNACGDPGAGTLMNSRLVEALDAPQQDDIDGARFVYGGGGEVGVPEGANGCAVVPPAGVSGVWLAALAAAFALRAGRRVGRPCRVKSSVDGSGDLF